MALCKVPGVFDTVEEYWDEAVLEKAILNVEGIEAESIQEFEAEFASYLGEDCAALFVSSGREAIRLGLGLLEPKPDATVVVPNFTCPVVSDAVLRAGFQISLFDFAPTVSWSDWDALELALRTRRVSAIIMPHLFGLPCDIRPLLRIARQYGVLIIEDCAHCIGGQVDGRMVGTLADLSIFSFNYDKPISLGGGGMLVRNSTSLVDEDKWQHVKSLVSTVTVTPEVEYEALREFKSWLCDRRKKIPEISWYYTFLRHRLRKLVGSVPFLSTLREIFVQKRPSISISTWFRSVGSIRAALGVLLLEAYPAVMEKRNDNYSTFSRLIDSYKLGELLICCPEDVVPAWLRAKLIMNRLSKNDVDRLGRYMCSQGFRVGRFNWPMTLCRKLKPGSYTLVTTDLERSEFFADRSLDIPIHQNMDEGDIIRMVEVLAQWLRRSR